jgi:hypothetical protein
MSSQAQQQTNAGQAHPALDAFRRIVGHADAGGAGAMSGPRPDPAAILADVQAVLAVIGQVVAVIAQHFPQPNPGPQPPQGQQP